MSDHSQPSADLSPALGGSRAKPEPEPEPEQAQAPPSQASDADPTDAELEAALAELAEIFGPDAAEALEALQQTGALGVGISNILTQTLQSLETQLPQTISAFEGLFSAFEQAIGEAFESRDRPDRRP